MALTPQKISARTILTGTGLISTPVSRAGSTTDYRVIDNLSATTDPGVGNDNTQSYHPGSKWLNLTLGRLWVCLDASTGAAVWRRLAVPSQKYLSGKYYAFPGMDMGQAAAASGNVNRIVLLPFIADADVTMSGIMFRLSAGAAGNIQPAIYASDPSTLLWTGNPLAKPAASASTAGSNTNIDLVFSSNLAIVDGKLYWLAINIDNASATTPQLAATKGIASRLIGDATASNALNAGSAVFQGYYITNTLVSGSWPDLTSTAATGIATAGVPFPMFKVA